MCPEPLSGPEDEWHNMFMIHNNQPCILSLNEITTSLVPLGKCIRFAIVAQIVFGH